MNFLLKTVELKIYQVSVKKLLPSLLISPLVLSWSTAWSLENRSIYLPFDIEDRPFNRQFDFEATELGSESKSQTAEVAASPAGSPNGAATESEPPKSINPLEQLKGIEAIGSSLKSESERLKSKLKCDKSKLTGKYQEFCESVEECVGSVESIPVQVADLSLDRAFLLVSAGLAKVSGLGGRVFESASTKVKTKAKPIQDKVDKTKEKIAQVQQKIEQGQQKIDQAEAQVLKVVDKVGQVDPNQAKAVREAIAEFKVAAMEKGIIGDLKTKYREAEQWVKATYQEIRTSGAAKIAEFLKKGEGYVETYSAAALRTGVGNLDRNWEHDKKFWLAKKLLADAPIQELAAITDQLNQQKPNEVCTIENYEKILQLLVHASSVLTAVRITIYERNERYNTGNTRYQASLNTEMVDAYGDAKPCNCDSLFGKFDIVRFFREYQGYGFDNPSIRTSCKGAYKAGLASLESSVKAAEYCRSRILNFRMGHLSQPQELLDHASRQKKRRQ